MPTNMTNMTIFKFPKYSCLRICNVDDVKVIVIDRICTCSKQIFQPKSNKHCTKTGNQKHTILRRKIKNTPHKDGKSKETESFRNDEITKTNERKQKICQITFLIRIEGKTTRKVIFESKLTLNHLLDKKKKMKGVTAKVWEKREEVRGRSLVPYCFNKILLGF